MSRCGQIRAATTAKTMPTLTKPLNSSITELGENIFLSPFAGENLVMSGLSFSKVKTGLDWTMLPRIAAPMRKAKGAARATNIARVTLRRITPILPGSRAISCGDSMN